MPTSYVLKYVAQFLPGGLETMIVLAWLSADVRVRAVASQWSALPSAIRQKVELEDLCRDSGVDAGLVFRDVAETAFELEIDISTFISAPLAFPGFLRTVIATPGREQEALRLIGIGALHHRLRLASQGEPKSETDSSVPSAPGRSRGPSRQAARGQCVGSRDALRACDRMARARKQWGLSQKQFADLFMTSVRTVRRWENREFAPTPHQQFFLSVFMTYIATQGLPAFARHFVRKR